VTEISEKVTAFVLAGGRSSRMSTNKALLELAGKSLIERAVSLAHSVAAEVQIVGDPKTLARFGTVASDVYPGRGPLGGIHAALLASPTDLNLVMGVDLPFLQKAFLFFLISIANSSRATVTVPYAGGHLQTLCSVYRREFATTAEKALVVGRNKIDSLFADVSVRKIEEHEIVRAGFTLSMFRNVNTPEEWESAKREFEAAAGHL
jgi:molybdenum cofactor guanylyltransferase